MPWTAQGVGEVYDTPRIYNGQWEKEFANGDHVCGTPEDFAGHSVKDEELPEVVYNEQDLPMCCDPVFIGSGGAVAGGTADVEVVSGYCPTYHVAGGPTAGLDLTQFGPFQWIGSPFPGAAMGITAPEGSGTGNWEGVMVSGSFVWAWSAPGTWDGHGSQLFTFTSGPFPYPDFTASAPGLI